MTNSSSHHFDVFNGDGDGILSLHQLRLVDPRKTALITGVKRDIELLQRVPLDTPAQITVLDISMESNASARDACLQAGHHLTWFDHHRSGEIPDNENLAAHIDTKPDTCTGLIVDEFLNGAQKPWAITAAYADNLHDVAKGLTINYSDKERRQLQAVGEAINYNAYGERVEDLHVDPVKIVEDLRPYHEPFDFYKRSELFTHLLECMNKDAAELEASQKLYEGPEGSCVLLPETPASTRMSGIYSNQLVREEPESAHAIFSRLGDGNFRISIRSPLSRPTGADELASAFPGGGGRAKAAGINSLAESELEKFYTLFQETFK